MPLSEKGVKWVLDHLARMEDLNKWALSFLLTKEEEEELTARGYIKDGAFTEKLDEYRYKNG